MHRNVRSKKCVVTLLLLFGVVSGNEQQQRLLKSDVASQQVRSAHRRLCIAVQRISWSFIGL